MLRTKQWIGLPVFLIVCLGAGGLGAIATTPEIESWYTTIATPSWNPPDWVFGPVWTTLYVMMGVAAWLVWRGADFNQAVLPLSLFGLQLGLNIGWSWVFFGLHQPGWALIEILILWNAILITSITFYRRSALAGWLLAPYLAWVSFASLLNFEIWRLNA